MWKTIVLAVLALIQWWTRSPSQDAQRELEEKVDEITKQIVSLSKKPPTYSRLNRIKRLHIERKDLNRKIRRLRDK